MSNMIPMGGYPVPLRPYSQITPFTYRDNSTYLEILEELRKWIQTDLVPHLDTEYAELSASWAANIAELETAVNDAIAQMIAEVSNNSVTANDPVVKALVQNVSSQTRIALDAIYATDVDVAAINTSITNLQTGLATANTNIGTLQTGLTTTNSNVTTLSNTVSTNNTTLAAAIAAAMPIGAITAFAGGSAPTGYVMCDGATLSKTTYAALWNVIGYTYGGSGSTFLVPNLQGRVPVGRNGVTFATLGATGGEETHTLTTAEMPNHTHTGVTSTMYYVSTGGQFGIVAGSNMNTNNSGSALTGSTGGGGAHNNLQPYQVVNYIIKAQ